MKDRIKQIRKFYKETQQTFADSLNVSKSTIEAIEYGRRDATDRLIKDICREYRVSESWLRSGEGEMFQPLDRESEIAEIVNSIYKENDPVKLEIIKMICNASSEQLQKWIELAHNFLGAIIDKEE